jgi:hypothetical protein
MKMWPIVVGLALVLTASTGGIAEERSMSPPRWNIGDTWTYSVQVPGQLAKITTVIVRYVTEADILVLTILPDGHYDHLRTRGNDDFTAGITTFGNVGTTLIRCVGTLPWPLSVGKRWSGSYLDRSTNPPTPVKVDIAVDAYEPIYAPVGVGTALILSSFRLALRACPEVSQGGCGSVRVWLSPQARNVTKVEFGRELWPADVRGGTVDLVGFTFAWGK